MILYYVFKNALLMSYNHIMNMLLLQINFILRLPVDIYMTLIINLILFNFYRVIPLATF